ncbi:MAG TPA: enoyl-CoA hydratase-related protein [Pseudoduganella sp.]|jgi:enoyl-CoA hydratase/carnithine racemase
MSAAPETASGEQHILHRTEDGVLHITFNRVARRHAITFDMYLRLAWLFTTASTDDAVRVVLLSGEGDYFTAGNDLADFIGYEEGDEFVPAHFLGALSRCTKPIVAAVEGGAIGVGSTLLLHCDVVYAGRSTKFLMPFINFALCPEGASSLLLPRAAGYKQAARWLLLGEGFGAADAQQAGLVTEVVDDSAALASGQRTAARLAALPHAAVLQTKALMRRAEAGLVQSVLDDECESFSRLLASPAAQSALQAFTAAAARRGAGNPLR